MATKSPPEAEHGAQHSSPTVSPVKRDPAAASGAANSPDMQRDGALRSRLLRHRESCRKSYNKKVTTITALKQELEALEDAYNALFSQQQLHTSSDGNAKSTLLGAHAELARVRRNLVQQNEELYSLNAASMMLEGRLQQVLDVDAPVPVSQLPFCFVPLRDVVCAQILTEARDDVLRFANSPNKLSLQASVFGWTDYRQVHGNELKFALEKQFPALSALEVVERTWRVVASKELCAQLFNPSLQANFDILQHIDADTLLMYRTIHADALGVTAKTVFLLSRIRLAHGYLILFRSIDPSLVGFEDEEMVNQFIEQAREDVRHDLGPPSRALGMKQRGTKHRDVWVDKYAWALVYEHGPQSCRFHFGGSTMSNVWLKEVLFVALRWEKMAIGPAFLLEL